MNNRQQKTIQIVVFVLVTSLLFIQQIITGLDNLAMVLANQTLATNQDAPVISGSQLSFIIKNLNTEKASNSQVYIRNIIMGNLYWKAGNENLALNYWHAAGIEPDFFIREINGVEQPSGLDLINRAVTLSPGQSELLYYKGLHFEKNEDYVAANQWYSMAEQQNNWIDLAMGFDVLYERGQLLFQNQQYPKAEMIFTNAIEFHKDGAAVDEAKAATVYRLLGLISQQNGQISVAKSNFLEAVKLNPEDFWNYLSLGLIAEAEKESEAIVFDYFNHAHIVASQSLLAYVYPASHYLGRNQLDKWRYFCEKTPSNLQREELWLDVCKNTQ